MTVKELIQILQTKNQNAEIKYVYDGPDAFVFESITKVETSEDEEIILE